MRCKPQKLKKLGKFQIRKVQNYYNNFTTILHVITMCFIARHKTSKYLYNILFCYKVFFVTFHLHWHMIYSAIESLIATCCRWCSVQWAFKKSKTDIIVGCQRQRKNRNKLIITAAKRENMQFKWFLSYCDLWIFIFCCLRCVSPSGLLLCQHVYQFQAKHRIPGLGQNLQNKSNTMIMCNNQNKTVFVLVVN